jgi:hypothetical protein
MLTPNSIDTTGLLAPQIPHAMKLLDSLYLNGIAFDLSETGVGKTYVAAWIAKQFNAPIVVICPKSVIPTWTKVLAIFGVKASILVNYEKLMRGGTPHVKYSGDISWLNPNFLPVVSSLWMNPINVKV